MQVHGAALYLLMPVAGRHRDRRMGKIDLLIVENVVIIRGFTEFCVAVWFVLPRKHSRSRFRKFKWQIPHKHVSVLVKQSLKTCTIPASARPCVQQSRLRARQSPVATRLLQLWYCKSPCPLSTVLQTRKSSTRTKQHVTRAA